jgi:YD repeat-containing protein
MKPLRVEYDPAVDALAIDFAGFGGRASAHTRRLDRDRAVDYDADGHLVSIELLNVSRGVNLEDLPESEVVSNALDLLAVRRPAPSESPRTHRPA